jgi:hypothetical protein
MLEGKEVIWRGNHCANPSSLLAASRSLAAPPSAKPQAAKAVLRQAPTEK